MPLVSVVIPAYNSENTVLETIQSVLQQTLTDLELIVINDGSTDSTLAALEPVKDPRLKVFSYQNGGLATARNRGIERASGQFVTFIDADDLWTPDKLEKQVAALQANSSAGVAYSWTKAMDHSGQRFYEGCAESYAGNVYAQLLRCNFITSGSNVMITREAIAASGIFDSTLRYCEDWDYYLRIARSWPFVCVPHYQILYRQTAGSLSTNVPKMEEAYGRVCDRAFKDVPERVQQIKSECLARVNQHLAQLYLKSHGLKSHGLKSHGLKGQGDRTHLRNAAAKLWQAARLWPKILLDDKTKRLLIKLFILWLLPAQGDKFLKRISVQRGSEYVEA